MVGNVDGLLRTDFVAQRRHYVCKKGALMFR